MFKAIILLKKKEDVTSEQFKNKLLNEVMGSVGKPMQKMLDSKMPEMTSPHVPLPYKLK